MIFRVPRSRIKVRKYGYMGKVPEGFKRLTIDIPKEIHTKLKVLTALRGSTIRKTVSRAIIKWVAEEERRESMRQQGG